jgi:hypothetical protein
MYLDTFESFFINRKKNDHPLHDTLTNLGWTFNKDTGRYDTDNNFSLVFTLFNEKPGSLAWKDGVRFPIGRVGGFDAMGMPIESTKNFPTHIGSGGISLDNTYISEIGDWRPELCVGNFSMANTKIKSLKGLEDMTLHGDLDVDYNDNLTDLQGIPLMGNNTLDIDACHNLRTLYGVREILNISNHRWTKVPDVEIDFIRNRGRFGIQDYWKELYGYVIEKQKYELSFDVKWPDEFFRTLPEEYQNMYNSKSTINKYNL